MRLFKGNNSGVLFGTSFPALYGFKVLERSSSLCCVRLNNNIIRFDLGAVYGNSPLSMNPIDTKVYENYAFQGDGTEYANGQNTVRILCQYLVVSGDARQPRMGGGGGGGGRTCVDRSNWIQNTGYFY